METPTQSPEWDGESPRFEGNITKSAHSSSASYGKHEPSDLDLAILDSKAGFFGNMHFEPQWSATEKWANMAISRTYQLSRVMKLLSEHGPDVAEYSGKSWFKLEEIPAAYRNTDKLSHIAPIFDDEDRVAEALYTIVLELGLEGLVNVSIEGDIYFDLTTAHLSPGKKAQLFEYYDCLSEPELSKIVVT